MQAAPDYLPGAVSHFPARAGRPGAAGAAGPADLRARGEPAGMRASNPKTDLPTSASRLTLNTTRWLWLIALLLTVLLARWQRVSGPTYPLSGRAALAGATFRWQLERSHAGPGDHDVKLGASVPGATGVLEWRAHGSGGAWTAVPMSPVGDTLLAPLPHQSPGTKLDYRVTLAADDKSVVLPPTGFATLRFRDDVPPWVLIPHILVMFGALLLSARTGLEAFRPNPDFRILTLRTLAALLLGGFVLGCMVSGYAFGQPWGGFPISDDLTDNKTLIAFLGWAVAAVPVLRGRGAKPFVIGAALLTFLVFVIPHSLSMPR